MKKSKILKIFSYLVMLIAFIFVGSVISDNKTSGTTVYYDATKGDSVSVTDLGDAATACNNHPYNSLFIDGRISQTAMHCVIVMEEDYTGDVEFIQNAILYMEGFSINGTITIGDGSYPTSVVIYNTGSVSFIGNSNDAPAIIVNTGGELNVNGKWMSEGASTYSNGGDIIPTYSNIYIYAMGDSSATISLGTGSITHIDIATVVKGFDPLQEAYTYGNLEIGVFSVNNPEQDIANPLLVIKDGEFYANSYYLLTCADDNYCYADVEIVGGNSFDISSFFFDQVGISSLYYPIIYFGYEFRHIVNIEYLSGAFAFADFSILFYDGGEYYSSIEDSNGNVIDIDKNGSSPFYYFTYGGNKPGVECSSNVCSFMSYVNEGEFYVSSYLSSETVILDFTGHNVYSTINVDMPEVIIMNANIFLSDDYPIGINVTGDDTVKLFNVSIFAPNYNDTSGGIEVFADQYKPISFNEDGQGDVQILPISQYSDSSSYVIEMYKNLSFDGDYFILNYISGSSISSSTDSTTNIVSAIYQTSIDLASCSEINSSEIASSTINGGVGTVSANTIDTSVIFSGCDVSSINDSYIKDEYYTAITYSGTTDVTNSIIIGNYIINNTSTTIRINDVDSILYGNYFNDSGNVISGLSGYLPTDDTTDATYSHKIYLVKAGNIIMTKNGDAGKSYSTISEALAQASSTDSVEIFINNDINECVTISTGIKSIKFDLNGKTWSCSGDSALYITDNNGLSGSVATTIEINDSTDVGIITSNSSSTIHLSYEGIILNVLKGKITNTASSSGDAILIDNIRVATINVGDSASNINNLQILSNTRAAIYSTVDVTYNMIKGLIFGKYGIWDNNSSSSITIGNKNSSSTISTLRIIGTDTGIVATGTFKFNRGFIGSSKGLSYAYDKAPTIPNGTIAITSITYNNTTYQGRMVASAHIGSVYYETISNAISALNSSMIVLDANISESFSFSSKKGTLDLNGKIVTGQISIYGSSSNITITDSSSSVGTITYSYNTIYVSSGTLNVLKGIIKSTNTSSTYSAINASSATTVNIGDSSSTISNLQILSASATAISGSSSSTKVNINNGLIVGKRYGVYLSSTSSIVNVGDSYSTKDTLQIISTDTGSSYYGVNASGTFTFTNGFIGSSGGSSRAYNKTPYIPTGYSASDATVTYDGTSVTGYEIAEKVNVAHIGSKYYTSLSDAFKDMTSSSITLILDENVDECVIVTGVSGVIDLNGKIWSCSTQYSATLSNSASNLTITDSSSSVGTISSTDGNAISVSSGGTLKILKGIIESFSNGVSYDAISVTSSAQLIIGDSSSTQDNLKITANIGYSIMASNSATVTINNGLINSTGLNTTIYATGSGTNVYIYGGVVTSSNPYTVYILSSATVTVGKAGTSINDLKIINTSTSTSSYGVNNSSGNFNFVSGFIGSGAGSSYAYLGTTNISGVAITTSTTYNSKTYQGKTVAVAHIGSTYYNTLIDGIKSLDSTSKTLILDSDVNECVYIDDTAVVGKINLNGKTWKCTNSPDATANAALAIYASSSGTSNLTITDTSSDSNVGTITSSSNDAIRFRGGTLTILRGKISVTATTGNPVPVWVPDSSSTLIIGDSSSNITNLQILNLTNGHSGSAISSSTISTAIHNGLIVGYRDTIYNDNTSYGAVFIGSDYSTTSTLRIIATESNTSYYAVNAASILQFNGGFVGSRTGSNYAFNKTPLLSEGKLMGTTSLTYNSVSYSGKIVSTAAAHIGSTSYATLAEGIKALNSSSKTLILDKNSTECISISDTVTGLINLNGKTWTCSGTALELTGDSSSITITDYSDNVGSITATVQVITIKNSSTLRVYKGIYKSTSSNNQNETFEINSGCYAYIGSTTAGTTTTDNLQIIGTAGAALYSNNATIYIYGGLIKSTGNSAVNFYKGNLYVYGGTIQATSSTSTYYAIYAHPASITIGSSTYKSNPDNLKILSNGGYAISLNSSSTLNLYAGVVLSTGNHGLYVNSGSTATIGDTSYSSSNNLYVLSGYSSGYAVYITGGSSSAKSTVIANVGFIGASSRSYVYKVNNSSYDVFTNNSTTNSGMYTYYDSKTYTGYHYGIVSGTAGSNNGYTMYGSIKAALLDFNSTSAKSISLMKNITECVTISTTIKGTIDLYGYTWSCSGNALRIEGSSNYSEITLANSRSYTATMTASSDTISINFAGTLTIQPKYSMVIKTTNTSTSYAAIWNTGSATINIGDSSTDISKLQILNTTGGYGIFSNAGKAININNGLIVGKTYGIYSSSSSTAVNIGMSSSTTKTLQIISTNTDSASYGVSASVLNYTKGFMGSGYGVSNAFKTTSMTGTADGTASVVYNSVTYTGISGQAVATIGTTKYGSIDDAINDLDSTTSKTIKLINDVNECVSITTAKKGTIDLNSKTWSCSGYALNMNNSSAYITITDSNKSNVGRITNNGSSSTIKVTSGTLYINYGIIESTSTNINSRVIYVNGGTLRINGGNTTNLQILSNAGAAIYITNNSSVTIWSNALIKSKGAQAIYMSGSSTNVEIRDGTIVSEGTTDTISVNTSANLDIGYLGLNSPIYIINMNSSTSYYAVKNNSSTVKFNGGFIGSAAGASYSYYSITIPTGVAYTTSYTYNGTTYSGKSIGVAHIGSTYYSTLNDAVAALDNTTAKTIVLDANIDDRSVYISTAVKGIIDLNGKTWSNDSTVISISSASDITITNNISTIGKISSMSTYGGYDVISVTNNGKLTILKGIIESDTNKYYSGTGGGITYTGVINVDNATLIVGGSVSTTSNLQILASGDAPAINAKSNATITINNGKLSNTDSTTGASVIYNQSTGNTITINKGDLSSTKGYGIYLASNGVINIGNENSTISNLKIISYYAALSITGANSNIHITAGLFVSSNFSTILGGNGTLTIGDYEYSTVENLQIITTYTSSGYYGISASDVDLYGGFVGATSIARAVSGSIGGSWFAATVTYNGTTYKGYGAPIAAVIGEVEYGTLQEAINALDSSTTKTIELQRNINECISITTTKKGIIDLNGYDWTCSSNPLNISGGTSNTSVITILDSSSDSSVGSIIANGSANAIKLAFAGTINIYKGIIKNNASGYSTIFVSTGYNQTINIGNESSNITNLQIINESTSNAVNISSYTGTLNINNGLIYSNGNGVSSSNTAASITIGAKYSSSATLYIYTASTSSTYKGVNVATNTSYKFNAGFIGHAGSSMSGHAYSVVPTSPYRIGSSVTNNGITIYGYKAGYTLMNNIYYGSLQYAVNALPTSSSSTSTTISLLADITETVTLSASRYGIINLRGNTWTGATYNAMSIGGTSSNKSNIVITDSSSNVGTVTAPSDTFSLNFAGTLTLLKGIFKTTNTGTNYAVIWNSGSTSSIVIGDENSNTSNLQILAGAGYAIYHTIASSLTVNNGLIVGKTYGIYSNNSSASIKIGASYTNSNNLKIFSLSTSTSNYGVYTMSSVTFNCGFVGSAASKNFSYSPNYPTNGGMYSGTETYNGTTITGLKTGYAKIYNVYYGGLQAAVDSITGTGTSPYIYLTANVNESVSISTSKNITIYLEGKTWSNSSQSALKITGGADNTSTITITDSSSDSSIGTITSTSNYAIDTSFAGTLNIYKGKITSTSYVGSIYSSNSYNTKINIGNNTSNETNLQILCSNSNCRGIYITPGLNVGSTLTINGGLIKSESFTIDAIGKSTININKGVIFSSNSVAISLTNFDSGSPTLTIGDMTTTSNTLKIISGSSSLYAIRISGSSSTYATLTINGGFMGANSGLSYSSTYTNATINGELGDYPLYYDGTTYAGKVVYAASVKYNSEATYYQTLVDAFESLTTVYKTLKLLGNRNECITITNKKVTIDLNGKVWEGPTDYPTLTLQSSSYVTINDTSGNIGKITNNYVGANTVEILGNSSLVLSKGIISSSNGIAVVLVSSQMSLGTSSGSVEDAQIISVITTTVSISSSSILTVFNGKILNTLSSAIYSSDSIVRIYKGEIFSTGSTYTIYGSFKELTIGNSDSRVSNLKIINHMYNTTIGFSTSENSVFNFKGGFIGNYNGADGAYTSGLSNVTYNIYGEEVNVNATYNNTVYPGKTVAVASIGDAYYYSLQDAFDALPTIEPSTYPTIKILGDRSEQVNLSATRYGIVDLNGKTWTSSNFNLYGTGGSNNKSNITITDNSGSIGSITSSIPGIYISDTQMNLKLIKGNYGGYYGIFFKGDTLTIGDSSSTLENLTIVGIFYGLYISEGDSKVVINGGKITNNQYNSSTYAGVVSYGNVIMNGGTVSSGGHAMVLRPGSELTMNGGTISGSSAGSGYDGIRIEGIAASPVPVVINGGNVGAYTDAIYAAYATITINSGSIRGFVNSIYMSNTTLNIGSVNKSDGPSIWASSTALSALSSTINMYNGTVEGKSNFTTGTTFTMCSGTIVGFISGSDTSVTIGVVSDDYYSSADRLKIFNTTSSTYAVTMTGGTFTFNRGFIGAASGNSYAYSLASGVSSIIGDVFNSSDTYSSTTYQGKAISVAHIGSTKYKTLKEAFDALDSTTTKTIVLDGNIYERIEVGVTKNGILDLNGNIWTYSNSAALNIVKSSSMGMSNNSSNLTITDNSSDADGKIVVKNSSSISIGYYFSGTLKLVKGNIYGIYAMSGNLVIGDSISTSNNLHILSYSSSGYAIVYSGSEGGKFTYNGGFIGSATNDNYNYAYVRNYPNVTYTINGLETNTAITYNGTTYYGVKLYVAHNQTNGTYYETLKDAFNGLSGTTTTKLWLDGNRSECVSVSKKILAEIDLRGYTWEAGSSCSITLSIDGGSDYSNVTITDTSSSVGKIIAGGTHAISAKSTLLNIYKGIITYKNSISSPTIWVTGKARINVGNSESTEENLQIYGDYYGIYIDDMSTTLSGTYVNTINAGLISANTYAVYFTSFTSVGAIMKLNVYGGTIKGNTGIYASIQSTTGTGVSVTIGNSKSTINNLKIVSTSATGYGVRVSGSSTNPSSLIINGGFIGSIDSTYGHTYSADSNTTVVINGVKINKTAIIDETTYYGFTVAIAHIGDTYYNNLEDAFDALSDTTTENTTIVLDGDPNECVSFSTTKIGTIDLNGKTWSCNGNTLLEINGGSSNKSKITITDNSGSIGTMDASVENIKAYFGGTLKINKGNLKALYYVISTSSSTNTIISLGSEAASASDLVISNTGSVPAINLANSILFMYNGTIKNPSSYNSAAGIYANNSSVYVYKGIIISDSYAINANNNSYIYVGNEYATIDNLKVISTSTSNNTINLANSSFTYSGGFISNSNNVAAYNKDTTGVTYTINGHEMDVNTTYEETTYTGITLAAASIGDTYYVYVQDAVDTLTSSSNDTTIKLEKNLAENVIINSKAGIIDLNDKTWYGIDSMGDPLLIQQNSNIIITSSASDNSEYGGTITGGRAQAINVDSTSTLKILKGKIADATGIESAGNLIIGDRNNLSDILIYGDTAINITGGTLVVNDGVIRGNYTAICSEDTKININKGIIYADNVAMYILDGTSLIVGNLDSTTSNLMIFAKDGHAIKLAGSSSAPSSFMFIGGFIGSSLGYDYAYLENASNVTYTVIGTALNTTATYDGVSYPGKTPVVAHIGFTYYNILQKAFDDLNENTTVDTTIVLDANISDSTTQMIYDIENKKYYKVSACVTIDTTKVGTVDLNGKSWNCFSGYAINITEGSSNLSNITITDSTSSVGKISGGNGAIYAKYDGVLNIYKGRLEGNSGTLLLSSSKVVVTIGNDSSTTANLTINSTFNYSSSAIFVSGESNNMPTVLINGGLIRAGTTTVSAGDTTAIYAKNANVTINKGEISGLTNAIETVGNTSLTIGNNSSTSSNLKLETTTSNGPVLKLGSGSSTIINNGSIVGNSGIEIDGGSLEVNGGTITGSGSTGISATNQANVTINGGNITSSTTYAIEINQSAYTMSGGTVTGTNGIQLVNTNDYSEIIITGGTIKGTGTNGVGIYSNGNNRVEISNVTIIGTSYGINSVNNNDKIIVNSGSITGNIGIQAEETYMVDIIGGTVKGIGSYAVNMVSGESFLYEGGTLIGSRTNNYSYYYADTIYVQINCEEYTIINNDNMYETNLVTEKVASIVGGGEYYKLSEAIDAAKAGDTIKILKDITPSQKDQNKLYYIVMINKKLNIDLNGKTINNYLFEMNQTNNGIFIDIFDDVKIVGTGNITSYRSTLKNVIRIDSGTLTLGDANEEYSQDLVVTSNFGYAILMTSNSSTFVYNSGKLVVNSSDSRFSNIYYIDGRFVTRNGYHVEMTHANNVHTAILVNESIINDNNQLEIIYKEANDKLHIIVKSNKKDRTGVETISLDISKKVDSSYQYVSNTCEITNKECETVIDSSDLAYLYNVTYANELVIRYVNKNSDGMVLAEESIAKDLTITPTGGTSESIYRGENDIISDGDILLLNVRDASTINDNMKANKEKVYAAIFGKHWNNILKTISDPQDVSNCSTSSGSVCTNLTSMGFTATYNSSAPIPAGGIIFNKILVYNYAPKLNENTTVQNVTCEYGSECEVSELSFLDYKGNKVENVENIITLNGEVVNKVDSKKLGTYVVTTYAIDSYGNRSKNIVRTYSVVDTEAPVIEVSDEPIYVEKGHGLKDLDIKASDNYDEDVTVEIITSGVNFNKKGTYEIIYKATDSSGNTTLIYRTVVVRNTREITLYIVIAILSLIILVLSFVIIKNKKRINV